jgi:hypothetical protein
MGGEFNKSLEFDDEKEVLVELFEAARCEKFAYYCAPSICIRGLAMAEGSWLSVAAAA